jgi:tRNA (guanine37-N1)-methyltransferase
MKQAQRICLITIFPGLFDSFLRESLIGRAISQGLIEVTTINFRDFSEAPHHRVDDTPYGGGAGMVIKAEPICLAIEAAKKQLPNAKTILLSASGSLFNQSKAAALSTESDLIFVCGRYEGIDQRAIDLCVDEEISIGNFVMMGGEVAAMAVIEAVVRLRPEVLGNSESIINESFTIEAETGTLLEAPQYTKPAEFRGMKVPESLLSGNHEQIKKWRLAQSLKRTKTIRPDLLKD